MGNSSVKSNESLSKQINELMQDYKFWTNKDMCNNLELFYRNKLMTFEDLDLINASISLGYKLDKNNINRDKICNTIIDHYKQRIDLLQKINKTLNECSSKLYRAKTGNVCLNYDGYIDDFYKCSQIPKTLWIDTDTYHKIIEKMKQNKKYDGWMKWITKLESVYAQYISEVKKIVDDLQNNLNNNISPLKFDAIKTRTETLLKRTMTLCDIYYILATNYIINS